MLFRSQANGNQTKYFITHGPFVLPEWVYDHEHETVIYNLVTKPTVADRPTYSNLSTVLKHLANTMKAMGFKRLAIPTIGCGIDGLDWGKVKQIIEEVFECTDIEILVCKR